MAESTIAPTEFCERRRLRMGIRDRLKPLFRLRGLLLRKICIRQQPRPAYVFGIVLDGFFGVGPCAGPVALLHAQNGVLNDKFRKAPDAQSLVQNRPQLFGFTSAQ